MKYLIVARGDGFGHAVRAVVIARMFPSCDCDAVVSSDEAWRMSGADTVPNLRRVQSADTGDYDQVFFDTWSPAVLPATKTAIIARGFSNSRPNSDADAVIVPGAFEGTSADDPDVFHPEALLAVDMLSREEVRAEKGWGDATVIGVVRVGSSSRSRVLTRSAQVLGRALGAVVAVFDEPMARRYFRGCDVLVGCCGWGTCYEALAAGVPLVAVDFGSPEHRGRAECVADESLVRMVPFNELADGVRRSLVAAGRV